MLHFVLDMSDTHCELTGLPTGALLDQAITEATTRSPEQAWILFARVDRIEYINTHYSREEGDEVLFRVSRLLTETVPVQLFRYEGPIFAIVTDGDTGHALALAERIRKAVAEFSELIESLTVSIALVGGDEADSAEALEDLALDRLQTARRAGGNTVSAVSAEEETDQYSSGTVLLVDPDAELLTVLIREVEARGYSVITAGDGMEALQQVTQISPDVIISELTVPKIDGLELRARLHRTEQHGSVPFILLAHRRNDQLIREAAALRILHYHQKPTSAVLIAELVHNLAQGRFRPEEAGCV